MFPSPWRNYCSANHSLLGRSQPANESSILPCYEYNFVATSQGQAIQEMNSSRPHEYHLCHGIIRQQCMPLAIWSIGPPAI